MENLDWNESKDNSNLAERGVVLWRSGNVSEGDAESWSLDESWNYIINIKDHFNKNATLFAKKAIYWFLKLCTTLLAVSTIQVFVHFKVK